MGILDKRSEARERVEGKAERSEAWAGPTWEYLAQNLGKVAGPALEARLDQLGAAGWEAVCVADGYLVFKRPS